MGDDNSDQRTPYKTIHLDSLERLAHAYWVMTAYSVHPNQFASRFGEQIGRVPILSGLEVYYEKENNGYSVQVFHTGGGEELTKELVRRLSLPKTES